MSESKDVVEERIYTIPLKHAWIAPVKHRVPRAVNILKEFIMKNMKPDKVIIDTDVNESLWSRGIEGLPRKIRVRAVKDKDNVVRVYIVSGEDKVT